MLMKLCTPKTTKKLSYIYLAVWVTLSAAQALAMTLLLVMPHKPFSDELDWVIFYWMLTSALWSVVMLILLVPLIFASTDYRGEQPLFTFNQARPFRSLLCWLTLGLSSVYAMGHGLYKTVTFWKHDDYQLSELVVSLPTTFSYLFFGYLVLSINAELISQVKS